MKETSKNWLDFASREIKAANELLADEFYSNIVCFHSQQAVEKALKALLEENSIQIIRIHSVLKLYAMLPSEIQSKLNIEKENLSDIDEIYAESRYPSDLGLLPNGFPDKATAKKYYDIASDIFSRIENLLKK